MNVSKKILALVLAMVIAFAYNCVTVSASEYETCLEYDDSFTAAQIDAAISGLSAEAAAAVEELYIFDVSGVDFEEALDVLINLTTISFSNCGITDISWISGHDNLEFVYLSNNSITDITPLGSLTSLSELVLSHNLIYDLSVFSTMPIVPTLDLSDNLITNVAPLLNSASNPYTRLDLDNNFISDGRALKKLYYSDGSSLQISGNYIYDSDFSENGYLYGLSCTCNNPKIMTNDPFLALFQNNTFKIIGYFGSINNKEAVIGTTVQVFDTQSRTISEVNISQLEQQNQQTYILRIEKNAFKNNVSVESWVIGNKVSFIDGYAFSRCTNMKRIKLGTGITTIKSFTFYYCLNLLGICIPDNVTTVEARAFDYCMRLKYVEFSNGNTSVHANTFSRCNEEYLTVYASSDINNWSSSTLKSSLDNLIINPTIDRNYEFKDGEMTDVVLTSTVLRVPAGIDRIDFGVQNNNTTYTVFTFIMPEGITFASIDLFAPSNTPVEILVPSTLSDLSDIDYLTSSNVTAYKYGENAQISNNNGYTINGDYEIAYDVLKEYVKNLTTDTNITVPALGFDIIEERAFYGADIPTDSINCRGQYIKSITLPNGIVRIKANAFRRLQEMTTFTFGSDNALKTIDNYAFEYDKELTSISIPQSVTSIGAEAFKRCLELTTVNFGINSQLSSIGSGIFEDCIKLNNNDSSSPDTFKLPNSITTIPARTFKVGINNGVNSYSSIYLPKNIPSGTSIDLTAFASANKTNINIYVHHSHYTSIKNRLLNMGFSINQIHEWNDEDEGDETLGNYGANRASVNSVNSSETEIEAIFRKIEDEALKTCDLIYGECNYSKEMLEYEIAFAKSVYCSNI